MGELFYERLFEVAPETRNMFPDDLTRQKEKFAQMLDIFVSRLDHSNFITDEIQDLGRRHVLYNVHAEHYNIVGDVILWMLERMLGHSFTPDVKLAWASAYETLSYVMQQNAQTTLSKEKSLDRMIKGGMVATYGLDDNLNLKSGND